MVYCTHNLEAPETLICPSFYLFIFNTDVQPPHRSIQMHSHYHSFFPDGHHAHAPSEPPHTGSACFPIIISLILQSAVQVGHRTQTPCQCCLRWHVHCSLISLGHHVDHIFSAGPTRLYPHLACPTLHTGRWVLIYGCLMYIISHAIKNWLNNAVTLSEPMHQVAKNCLYSTFIMFLFTIGFGQIKIFRDSCWLGHTWRTIAPNECKLRLELALPSLSTPLHACLVHLILQHSLDGGNEPINLNHPSQCLQFIFFNHGSYSAN